MKWLEARVVKPKDLLTDVVLQTSVNLSARAFANEVLHFPIRTEADVEVCKVFKTENCGFKSSERFASISFTTVSLL